jgi:hypothetical protein
LKSPLQLFNHELFYSKLFNGFLEISTWNGTYFLVLKFIFEEFMVKEFMVKKSGLKRPGLKYSTTLKKAWMWQSNVIVMRN